MRCYIVDSVIGKFNKKDHTFILPILIQIGGDSFIDDQAFNNELISNALDDKKKMTTSQPNIGNTLNLFEELKKTYTEFVLIHTSSKISGTYATCASAAQQSDINFIAIDSNGVGPHIELLLNIAMENENMELKELEDLLNKKASTAGAIIIPGSLERLHLSGRINLMQMLLSDILKIVPVFLLENGELKTLKKERSHKKAIKTMLEYVKDVENKMQVAILEYEFKEVELLKETLGKNETTELHPALLVHLGRNSVGILWN